eukprot:3339801-Pyramimonas_sp.AAC.1
MASSTSQSWFCFRNLAKVRLKSWILCSTFAGSCAPGAMNISVPGDSLQHRIAPDVALDSGSSRISRSREHLRATCCLIWDLSPRLAT